MKLTDNNKNEINKLIKEGCTDSHILDFCDANKLSRKAVYHYIAELTVPQQCKGCKNIVLYPSMPPCASCCRSHTKDYFEPDGINNVKSLDESINTDSNTVWELATTLVMNDENREYNAAFDGMTAHEIMQKYSAQEALEKYRAYKKGKS